MTKEAEVEIVIGEVVGPFGIKGEVKVRPDTDFPDRFLDLEEATLLMPDKSHKTLDIEDVRFHKGMALIKFADCPDMTAAEQLRGAFLVISEDELVELPEDEFYIHELVGLKVQSVSGKDLGEIIEVIRGKGNDSYLTTETIVPALRSVVKEVDIDGGKMIVDLPEMDSE